MFSRKNLKYVAGAVALALSGHVLAGNTTAVGTGSTLFLTINDPTLGTGGEGYVLDLSQAVVGGTAFTGTSNASFNISALGSSNLSSFLGAVGSDSLTYAVLGGEEPTAGNAPVTIDVSGVALPGIKTLSGITGAYGEINDFLTPGFGITNPSGGDSYQTASSATGWYAAGHETNLYSAIHDTDDTSVGTSLNFYQLVASATGGHTNGTYSTFAGTWDLQDLAGDYVLSYTVPGGGGGSPVPLPAPLLLLLSGLGLMGLIGRRRNAGESNYGGAAA